MPSPSRPQRVGLPRWSLRVLAFGYPLALLAIIIALRGVGERWWLTTVALYVPRAVFLLPLPVLALALAIWDKRRLLLTQLAAALLALFPLMGLRLPGHARATPGALRFRLLSFNVATGSFGIDRILGQIQAADPDVFVLQEARPEVNAYLRGHLGGYNFHEATQFLLATRFPIVDVFYPPMLMEGTKKRSPRFMRYTIQTPAGLVDVFDVHPISPREGLDDLHGEGFREEILTGRLFTGSAAPIVTADTSLRAHQVQTISTYAGQSAHPVLIAGDTNLPGLSWLLPHYLGGYQDGFSEAGSGFGYSFPATRNHPWMRIDRVLAGPQFRFIGFRLGREHASDHYCVIADLELGPPDRR